MPVTLCLGFSENLLPYRQQVKAHVGGMNVLMKISSILEWEMMSRESQKEPGAIFSAVDSLIRPKWKEPT